MFIFFWNQKLYEHFNRKIILRMVEFFMQCLSILNRNKADFFRRYITVDETWLHHYTPESKRQSAEWSNHDEPNPKRGKTQQSAGNVMASVWDALGIIFIDYLEKGRTINSDYYMACWRVWRMKLRKIGPIWRRKKCCFIKTMHHVTNQRKRWQNWMN